MPCEECGKPTRVIDVRHKDGRTSRRHECSACFHRFNTYEWAIPKGMARKASLILMREGIIKGDEWRREKQADWERSGRHRPKPPKPGQLPLMETPEPIKMPELRPGATLRERLAHKNASRGTPADPVRAVALAIGYDYDQIGGGRRGVG